MKVNGIYDNMTVPTSTNKLRTCSKRDHWDLLATRLPSIPYSLSEATFLSYTGWGGGFDYLHSTTIITTFLYNFVSSLSLL